MRKIFLSVPVLLLAIGGHAAADERRDAVAGAVIGSAAGAVIGHHLGGRDGALVGGAMGAATGVAVATGRDGRTYRDSPPAVYERERIVYVQPEVQERVVYVQPAPVVVYRPVPVAYHAVPVVAVPVHPAYGKHGKGHYKKGYYKGKEGKHAAYHSHHGSGGRRGG